MRVETLTVTGHRPHKILVRGQKAYDGPAYAALVDFAEKVLHHLDPRCVITGMALGWDQAIAEAAERASIPFIAYVPFLGQESRWPTSSQKRYADLLAGAKAMRICSSGGYSAAKMQKRNELMVDGADAVAALWDGSAGGTANCVRYAESQSVRVVKCWPSWLRHVASLD